MTALTGFPFNAPSDLSAEAGEEIERIIADGPPGWVRKLLAGNYDVGSWRDRADQRCADEGHNWKRFDRCQSEYCSRCGVTR